MGTHAHCEHTHRGYTHHAIRKVGIPTVGIPTIPFAKWGYSLWVYPPHIGQSGYPTEGIPKKVRTLTVGIPTPTNARWVSIPTHCVFGKKWVHPPHKDGEVGVPTSKQERVGIPTLPKAQVYPPQVLLSTKVQWHKKSAEAGIERLTTNTDGTRQLYHCGNKALQISRA
ncbi:hypothetical protein FB45DRAFT_870670 [Roridomyces roridus]|uniref:Uncharacterized protein n=1 Tax=Roridomyces roridus TaxID=1738132 RepID=A0AAD7BJ09_9AGAR|nr:hypothetical protein FB45DRAFT_870670 [Roridomyces roridus]